MLSRIEGCDTNTWLMIREQENRIAVRFLLWCFVAEIMFVMNVQIFDETWTTWNLLYLASEVLLLVCLYRRVLRGIQRLEQSAARWISLLIRGL